MAIPICFVFFFFFREVESALLDTYKVFLIYSFVVFVQNFFFKKKKRGASVAIYIAAIYRKKVLTNTKSEPEQRHREDMIYPLHLIEYIREEVLRQFNRLGNRQFLTARSYMETDAYKCCFPREIRTIGSRVQLSSLSRGNFSDATIQEHGNIGVRICKQDGYKIKRKNWSSRLYHRNRFHRSTIN